MIQIGADTAAEATRLDTAVLLKTIKEPLDVATGFDRTYAANSLLSYWNANTPAMRAELDSILAIANRNERWKAGEQFVRRITNGINREVKYIDELGVKRSRYVDSLYQLRSGKTVIGEVKTYEDIVTESARLRAQVKKDFLIESQSGERPVWFIIAGRHQISDALMRTLQDSGIEIVILL